MSDDALVRKPVGDYRPLTAPHGAKPFHALRAIRSSGSQPMILIHGVERRIRALGHEPVRTFDVRRGWKMAVNGAVIASGRSLSELAQTAAAWLSRQESGDAIEPLPGA